jgi:CRP/FNR family transcriptional regulator, cyclic AMP receptor protein
VTLFHEGDDAGPVIVLLSGRAKISTIGGGGREAIVAVRDPGDLIGELSAHVIGVGTSGTIVAPGRFGWQLHCPVTGQRDE